MKRSLGWPQSGHGQIMPHYTRSGTCGSLWRGSRCRENWVPGHRLGCVTISYVRDVLEPFLDSGESLPLSCNPQNSPWLSPAHFPCFTFCFFFSPHPPHSDSILYPECPQPSCAPGWVYPLDFAHAGPLSRSPSSFPGEHRILSWSLQLTTEHGRSDQLWRCRTSPRPGEEVA